MAIPSTDPAWATSTNYPAGAEPEQGTPTKVAYTENQDTLGYRPDAIPDAQEENSWRNLVYLWIVWFKAQIGVTRHKLIPGRSGFGMNAGNNATGGTSVVGGFGTTEATFYALPLPFDAGDRIRSFSFYVFGNGAVDIGNIKLMISNISTNTDINIGTTVVTDPPASYTLVSCDCTDTVLAIGDQATISMDISGAGLSLYFFDVVYDHGIV